MHAAIFGAGALAGAALQPVSWACAFAACRQRQWGRALVAFALGFACLVYATLSSLGFVSTSRTDATAARSKSADTYALTKAEAEAAVVELKTLAAAPHSTKKVDAHRSERRTQLERIVAKAQSALRADSTTGQADPAAASLAAYAAALGLNWTAEQIAPWITAVTVLFFEVCSSASLIVVSVLAAVPAPVAKPAAAAPDELPTEAESDQSVATAKKRGRRRAITKDDLLNRLRSAGGNWRGNLASLSEVVGVPKSTLHRHLSELETGGHVLLNTDREGTSIAPQ